MGFKFDECKMKNAKCKIQNRMGEAGSPLAESASDHFAFFILHFAFCNGSNYEMLH